MSLVIKQLRPPSPTYGKLTCTISPKSRPIQGAAIQGCVIYQSGEAELFTHPDCQSDHVYFDIPIDNLDHVASILINYTNGELYLDHMVLEVPSMHFTQQFVATNDCVYMPFKPKEVSEEKIQQGLREYAKMKQDILLTTLCMVGAGSVYDIVLQNEPWFAVGGLIGMVYQLALQKDIDDVGEGNRVVFNSFLRLSFLPVAITLLTEKNMDMQTFTEIVMGFMVNKIAMYHTFWMKRQ